MLDVRQSWTRSDLIHEAHVYLRSSNIKDLLRNIEWMLCELLECSRAQLYAYPEATVSSEVVVAFENMLRRRYNNEPLQYILGYTHFFGLRVKVTQSALIPRPETEQLVEEGLHKLLSINNPSILDIGTGSGCIALAIKHQRPDAHVFACDISNEALDLAKENAYCLNKDIHFFEYDVLSNNISPSSLPLFDLIISNPPYIPYEERSSLEIEVKDFEPEIALFVDLDPIVFYRKIVTMAQYNLKESGRLLFETHSNYASSVSDLLLNENFSEVTIKKDLAGLPRIVSGTYHTLL